MDPLSLSLDVPLREFALRVELAVGREVVALVGPSGAGKTTLLRAIAGLQPARGAISVDGDAWLDSARGVDLPAEERSVGVVFQDYALFPHLSVRKNVEFGRRGDAGLLDRFGLTALADVKPRELYPEGELAERNVQREAERVHPGISLRTSRTAAPKTTKSAPIARAVSRLTSNWA